jgi:hypothetical protein
MSPHALPAPIASEYPTRIFVPTEQRDEGLRALLHSHFRQLHQNQLFTYSLSGNTGVGYPSIPAQALCWHSTVPLVAHTRATDHGPRITDHEPRITSHESQITTYELPPAAVHGRPAKMIEWSLTTGATRFRRKLSRLEGMPAPTWP